MGYESKPASRNRWLCYQVLQSCLHLVTVELK